MKVNIENLSDTQRKLLVTVPADVVKSERDAIFKEIYKLAKVKGFRPGKAPVKVVESMYKGEILSETMQKILSKTLEEALKEANVNSFLALNCALISAPTNRSVGRKEPLEYLKERYQWVRDDIIHQRLNSHLIPIKQLASGGYDGLGDEERTVKIKKDFEDFLKERAHLVYKAMQKLVTGQHISAAEIIG